MGHNSIVSSKLISFTAQRLNWSIVREPKQHAFSNSPSAWTSSRSTRTETVSPRCESSRDESRHCCSGTGTRTVRRRILSFRGARACSLARCWPGRVSNISKSTRTPSKKNTILLQPCVFLEWKATANENDLDIKLEPVVKRKICPCVETTPHFTVMFGSIKKKQQWNAYQQVYSRKIYRIAKGVQWLQ